MEISRLNNGRLTYVKISYSLDSSNLSDAIKTLDNTTTVDLSRALRIALSKKKLNPCKAIIPFLFSRLIDEPNNNTTIIAPSERKEEWNNSDRKELLRKFVSQEANNKYGIENLFAAKATIEAIHKEKPAEALEKLFFICNSLDFTLGKNFCYVAPYNLDEQTATILLANSLNVENLQQGQEGQGEIKLPQLIETKLIKMNLSRRFIGLEEKEKHKKLLTYSIKTLQILSNGNIPKDEMIDKMIDATSSNDSTDNLNSNKKIIAQQALEILVINNLIRVNQGTNEYFLVKKNSSD